MSSILLRSSKIDYLLMDQVPIYESTELDRIASSNIFSQNSDNGSDLSSAARIGHNEDGECFDYHDQEMKQCGIPVCSPNLSVPHDNQFCDSIGVFSNQKNGDKMRMECENYSTSYNDISHIESFKPDNPTSSAHNSGASDISRAPADTVSESAFIEKHDQTVSLSPNSTRVFKDGQCLEPSPESAKNNVNFEQDVDVSCNLPSEALQEDECHPRMAARVTNEICPFSENEILPDSISQEKLSSFEIDDGKNLMRSDVTCKKQSSKVLRSTSPPQAHRCQLCGKHYRHVASLRNHMRKHASGALVSKRHKCPYCVYSSQYNRNVLKHIEAVHQNSDTFLPTNAPIPNNSCYIDRNVVNGMNPAYWSPVNLNEHLYKAQDGSGSLCNITNQCFYKQQTVRDSNEAFNVLQGTDTSSLDTYQQAPTGSMTNNQTSNSVYYCDTSGCEKSFKNAKCLPAHLNDCRREIRFKCPVNGCNFDDERQEHLKRHINQYHSERKNYLQELLTNVSETQPGAAVPAFYASNNLRSQLTNPPNKRQVVNIPFQNDSMVSATQHIAHGYLPQTCPEPTRRIGMDVYSFPGSAINQVNDFASRIPHAVKFDESLLNEAPTDRKFDSGDELCQSRFQTDSIRPMNILRTGSDTPTVASSVSRLPAVCMGRLDMPGSCKRTESPFYLGNSYDNVINQTPRMRSADDSTQHITSPYSRIHAPDRRDSVVRSTVEQLLCAPDHANQSLEQLFHEPSTATLTASDEFTSRGSPLEDLMSDGRRESNSNTRENESTSAEFDSPNNPQDFSDNMSDTVNQKHVNSETDAFFSDLQEILARDMSSLDNSTPKTAEWLNVNPASVGLKEDGPRSGEFVTSKSPFIGYGAKPVCTASLLSGDSGVESWSSSSSCSAGPNGSSSVWGPPESICNLKSSPSANTPQPASVLGSGSQEPIRMHFDGYSNGHVVDESSAGIAVSQDSRRTPSRTYENIPPGSSEGHESSFAINNTQGLLTDQSLLSPMISTHEQAVRGMMDERNLKSSQCMDTVLSQPQAASVNRVFNTQTEVTCNPTRTASHPFSSVDPTFEYRRNDSMDLTDTRMQSNPIQTDTSSASQSAQYGRPQHPSNLNNHRGYIQQQQQQSQQHLQQHVHQNGNLFMETPNAGFDMNTPGITRHSRQMCTKFDRTAMEQQQQQGYHKSNPCPPFEQTGYRPANYVRPIGPSTVPSTIQVRPESSYVQSHNVPGGSNPAQPSTVERRHGFVTCDVSRVESDGSMYMSTASEQTAEVDMKSTAAHLAPFASGRANPYSYNDAPGAVRTDPVPMSNTRYAWSGNYPVPSYQAYPSTQQQQSYKAYYGNGSGVCGGPYDPAQTANNMIYSMDQYGTHAPYSRQPNIPPCEAQLFMYHHQEHSQQQQQQQSQPMNNPASMPSFSNYKAPSTNTQPVDPITPANYPHNTQRTPQHPSPRLPQTIPQQQQNMQVRSRNPVQQLQQPPQRGAPYSTIERQTLNRMPEIPNTTDLYPNTAGADLNPVWPAAVDSCSTYLPDSNPLQNGPKSAGVSGSLPASVACPAGSGAVCAPSYQAVEPDCSWIPSISAANADSSVSSYGVRSLSISASPTIPSQSHHGMDRSGNIQPMDALEGSLPTCPTVINR